MGLIQQIFGSKNQRELKKLQPNVDRINQLEAAMKAKSDAELKAITGELRTKLDNGATLDDILCDAFAAVREAGVRVLGMRHYDVQMIGGMILHSGRIAEMRTGEGKTLVATLPCYLNALPKKGVHVVTVNDYLAKRDAEWMGRLHGFLGLTTGVVVHGLDDYERQRNYNCDITYGQNNEFGFDYLRDNMKNSPDKMVQRGLNYAIVDEVDSILIDEARTPLIISGSAEQSADWYVKVDRLIPRLKREVDYTVDEKAHSAMLTDDGVEAMEKLLDVDNLFEAKNIQLVHHVNQALRAHTLYKRNVNYLVEEGKVVIVDEHTGRKMPGRRWSDGLHQAVEAKEGVQIERETQTLATITIQNYFRLYKKLAGMTGTAETEAAEFLDIYKLGVLTIPTNRPNIRKDGNDSVYKTRREKFNAVVAEIKNLHGQGRPILVGTVSVDSSEMLSRMLKKEGLIHSVLNAKYHQQEAEIVARAGQRGAITIATNMAGRGTDIKLGAGVPEAGGLHVLGTERHESRRIDRQLRGRCSRQGDPGSSHFFISLEDDLMRLFGSDRIVKMMERMGLEEGEELKHGLLNRSIQQAQKRVEQHNFQIRKRTLEYDDVMNKQREVIYGFRNEIINSNDVRDRLMDIIEEVVVLKVEQFTSADTDMSEWKIRLLADWVNLNFPLGMPEEEIVKAAQSGRERPVNGSLFDGLSEAQFAACNFISDNIRKAYELKVSFEEPEKLAAVERYTILSAIDKLWQEHLYEMDSLRQSIGLRAHGQRDPLLEYKAEAFKIFNELMVNVKTEICHNIFRSASSMMAFENFLKNVPQQTLHQNTSAFGETTTASSGGAPRKASD